MAFSCGGSDGTRSIGQSYRSPSESVDLNVTADRTQATNPDSSSRKPLNERPSFIGNGMNSTRDPSPTRGSPRDRDRDQGSGINSETRASTAVQGGGTSSSAINIDHNNNGITVANNGNEKRNGVTVPLVAGAARRPCEMCDLEMPVEATKCSICNSVSSPTSTSNSLSSHNFKPVSPPQPPPPSSYKAAPSIVGFGASKSEHEKPENDNQATPGDLDDSPGTVEKKAVVQSPEWHCEPCGRFNALEATKCATCTAESSPTSTTNSLSSHNEEPVSPPPPSPPSSNKTPGDDGGSPGTAEKRPIDQSSGWHCQHCGCFNTVGAECCKACDKVDPRITAWNCPKCTYRNGILSPSCEACGAVNSDVKPCGTCENFMINTRFSEVCDACYERNAKSTAITVTNEGCSGEHVEGERGSRNSSLGDRGNEGTTRWYVDESYGDSPCVTSDGASIEGGRSSARSVVAEREDSVSIDRGRRPDIRADDKAIVRVIRYTESVRAPIDADTVE